MRKWGKRGTGMLQVCVDSHLWVCCSLETTEIPSVLGDTSIGLPSSSSRGLWLFPKLVPRG